MTVTTAVQEANWVTSAFVWTTVTAAHFLTKDQYGASSSYPIKIPTSGFKYSFWKHWALYYSSGTGTISNIRIYSGKDLATWLLGTGGMVLIGQRDSGDHGCPSGSLDAATGSEGDTGDYLKDGSLGHTYYKGQTAAPLDFNTIDTNNAVLIDSGSYDTATQRSNSAVLQVKVDTDATQGAKAAKTFTFRYDEV